MNLSSNNTAPTGVMPSPGLYKGCWVYNGRFSQSIGEVVEVTGVFVHITILQTGNPATWYSTDVTPLWLQPNEIYRYGGVKVVVLGLEAKKSSIRVCLVKVGNGKNLGPARWFSIHEDAIVNNLQYLTTR